jgi:hypothetical protein
MEAERHAECFRDPLEIVGIAGDDEFVSGRFASAARSAPVS